MRGALTSRYGFLTVALLTSAGADAQIAPERYICDFSRIGATERLKLEFVYDRPQNRGLVVGNNGMSPVVAWQGSEALSFIELLAVGVAQTTSITPNGAAVHSRHTLGQAFMQSQWLGQCRKG